jgi:hypothetical protein
MRGDDAVGVVMGLVVYGGMLVLLVVAFIGDRARIARIRREWAAKLDGRLDGWTIVFEADGSEARLAFCDGWLPGRTFTSIRVDLRGRAPGWVRVDESGEATSKPPELARELFGGEWARGVVDGVRRIGAARILIARDAMTVRVAKCLRDERRVMALVQAVRVLCTHVCAHAPAGAVEAGRMAIGEGKCPVCQDDAPTRLVRCRTCRTPHHADCWEFTGLCAVFACGSRQHT